MDLKQVLTTLQVDGFINLLNVRHFVFWTDPVLPRAVRHITKLRFQFLQCQGHGDDHKQPMEKITQTETNTLTNPAL